VSVCALPTTQRRHRPHDVAPRSGMTALSPRECEVLDLYPSVSLVKLIAPRMCISQQTVKNHIGSILAKLDCISLGQAAVRYHLWLQDGALSWPEVDRRSGRQRRAGVERRA
jgi:DNA-binding NarL/FixJ family response regulator